MTKSRFVRRSVSAFVLAVFLSACGSSTTTPAVDAKLVEQRLNDFVASITTSVAGGEMTAKAEGAAKVETQSDGTVTGSLPRITFTSKDGGTAVLDPISVKFANGGDGLVNVSATIPDKLSIKDKTGKVEGAILIGSQAIKGVWSEKVQTFNTFDMSLTNLAITSQKEEGSGKIAKIALTGKLDPKGGGVYGARYDFETSGFVADDPKAKSVTTIGALRVVSTMDGAKLEAMASAAKEAGYTLSNPNLFKLWTGGQIDAKMIAFLKKMPSYLGTTNYVYSINDIDVVTEGKPTFGLKKTEFGVGVGPDGTGMTKVRMSFGFGGLSGSPEEPFLPPEADVQDAALEIDASGVPGQKLWDIYMDALPALQAEAAKAASQTATGSSDATTAGAAALEQVSGELSGKFLEVLSASKLQLAFNKLNLLTPTAKMMGKGTASYLPATSMLPEGKIALRFTGIDALAKAMEKRGAKDELAQQVMGVVAGVRAMGKPDPASPANDRAYLIDVVFTKDGQVLANGQKVM